MQNRKMLLLAGLTALVLPLQSVLAQPAPPPPGAPGYYGHRPPMPPPRYEHRPPSPPGAYHWAWRGGRWNWTGSHWVWVSGRWYH
jgi:hypothetical protein